MKNLMDKHAIIKLKEKGVSNRKVAKILGINRKTVGTYWNDYQRVNAEIKKLEKEGGEFSKANIIELQEELTGAPKYNSKNRRKRKYTDEIDSLVDEILSSEEEKCKKLGPNKQKLSYYQIWELVVEKGHDIGLTTISENVKLKRNNVKESFIKQDYEYGDRLEYDFGEVKLEIDGEVEKYYLAVFCAPASNFRYAYLYKNQKQDVFLDSHIRFFKMLGGVYKEVVYDNMRNVVTKFIGRNEKMLNKNLLSLSIFYGFDINVTNCFKGNEKGSVEGSVKVIRNKIFAKNYQFNTLKDARDYLEKGLEKLNVNSDIDLEKEQLKECISDYQISVMIEKHVDSYSFIKDENNKYSVPDYLVGKRVNMRRLVEEIQIYSNNKLVCTHKKKDGFGEISIDIMHYLNTLSKKPGAIKNSLALKSIPMLKTIFDIHYTQKPKEFIDLLKENKDKSMEEIYIILNEYVKSNKAEDLNRLVSASNLENKTKHILLAYSKISVGGGYGRN